MAERIIIDGITDGQGIKGRLAINPLWRGNGDKQTDVTVHFLPEGTTYKDYADPKKGIQVVGHYKFPATLESTAKSIKALLKAKNHIGD